MTQKEKTIVREAYIARLSEMLAGAGEDCGLIAGGTLNLPVAVDGIEAWIEVKVSVPTYDEADADAEGYQMRADYLAHKAEVAERARARHEAAEAKKAKDAARRAEKAAKKEG